MNTWPGLNGIWVSVLLALSLISFHTLAEEVSERKWSKVKDKQNIQVYRAHSEDSQHKTFRSVNRMEVEDIRSFVAMMLDGQAYPKWGHMVKEAKVSPLEQAQTYELYLSTSLPWPVKDRHVKGIYTFTQKEDLSIYVKLEQSPTPPEPRKGYIISPETFGYFQLNVIPDSKEVEVISEVFIDPGGYVPAFLVNLIMDDVAFYSSKKLRRYISNADYQDSDIDFIQRRPWVVGAKLAEGADSETDS